MFNRYHHQKRGDTPLDGEPDAGFAVLLTVLIVAVVFSLIGILMERTVLSTTTITSSNVHRQQAEQAAQSGISVAYNDIRSATGALPCGATGRLGSSPSTSSYSVTAKYYVTATGQTAESCTVATDPQSVLLTSTGHTGNQTVTLISEAYMTRSSTQSPFTDAAFVGGNFTVSGADSFKTPGKAVYVQGNVQCGSGGALSGTLIATGTLTLTGDCTIAGSAEANGLVDISGGSPSVGHTLISATTSTPGIKISGNPTLHGVFAKTRVTYPSWWTSEHPDARITQNDSSITPVPSQTFPQIHWTLAGWTGKGYKAVTAGATCAKAYQAIFAAHTAVTPTTSATSKPIAVNTSCKINIPNSTYCPSWEPYYCTKLPLARNLIVFSTARFTLPTPFSVTSVGTSPRQLGLIVPSVQSGGAPTKCSGSVGDITMTGHTHQHVDTLLYTPCTVSMSGAATVTEGEVYAGTSYKATGGMGFGAPLTIVGASGGTTIFGQPSIGVVYIRQAS